MIEYEFTDLISLQIDIKQHALINNNYDIKMYSAIPNSPLKLGWKLEGIDKIWTIRVKNIAKIYNKKMRYICF